MNLNKNLILEDFNYFIICGKSDNIKILLKSNKFSLCEKIILTDMFISYKLYTIQGFIFDSECCFEEIYNLNYNLLYVYNTNEQFFINTYNDIDHLLKDKKIKTNFSLNFYNIDTFVYLNLIIKSTYYISYDYIHDDSSFLDGMLHRNVVLSNISKGIKVFKMLNILVDIQKNTIKLIMCLASSNTISQKKIIIRVKGHIKCNFYVKLNLITNLNYADRLYINFSKIKLKNFNNYFIGASYLTLNSFIKRANFQLLKNNINPDAIVKLSEQPIYIDFSQWELAKNNIIENIKQKYNINVTLNASISDIINELINQKNDQTLIINQYKLKKKINNNNLNNNNIENVYLNNKQELVIYKNNELENSSNNIYDILNFKNVELNFEKQIIMEEYDFLEEDLKHIELITKNLTKEIQQLYYILAAEKAKLFIYPIYIPYYYDFRGRIYPKSVIGFTYLKILRAFFKLPNFDNELNYDNIKNSIYFKKLINLNINIDKRLIISKLSDINKYFLIIHLLELGKYNKGKLATISGLTVQNLVDNGTEFFFNKKNNFSNTDEIVYMKLISDNILNYLKYNKFNNITIIRDSTASFLQHWSIKLQVKPEYLNKLNLNGDIWYDTYTFIIDIFLNENPEFKEKLKNILKRNILKNFIMITNYNAGLYKCYINLKDILNDAKIPFNETELNLFSQKFFKFLKDNIFNILFINSKDEFLKKTGVLVLTDDKSSINLTYLNYKEFKDDIKFYKYRWVILRKILIDTPCDWKTQIALNANIIQASDAELARYLINNLNIQSVHDSFAINLFELHQLIDLTNKFFNKKLNNNNYSIFILI